jgi:hypothetical protein
MATAALQLGWFLLAFRRIISPTVGLLLVGLTFLGTLWLLPFLVPVRKS